MQESEGKVQFLCRESLCFSVGKAGGVEKFPQYVEDKLKRLFEHFTIALAKGWGSYAGYFAAHLPIHITLDVEQDWIYLKLTVVAEAQGRELDEEPPHAVWIDDLLERIRQAYRDGPQDG